MGPPVHHKKVLISALPPPPGHLGPPLNHEKVAVTYSKAVEEFQSTICEKSKKSDFQNAQNILNDKSQSELSAGGMKRDVEKTPKCTRLNCILASRSCPLGLAGHRPALA